MRQVLGSRDLIIAAIQSLFMFMSSIAVVIVFVLFVKEPEKRPSDTRIHFFMDSRSNAITLIY